MSSFKASSFKIRNKTSVLGLWLGCGFRQPSMALRTGISQVEAYSSKLSSRAIAIVPLLCSCWCGSWLCTLSTRAPHQEHRFLMVHGRAGGRDCSRRVAGAPVEYIYRTKASEKCSSGRLPTKTVEEYKSQVTNCDIMEDLRMFTTICSSSAPRSAVLPPGARSRPQHPATSCGCVPYSPPAWL